MGFFEFIYFRKLYLSPGNIKKGRAGCTTVTFIYITFCTVSQALIWFLLMTFTLIDINCLENK